MTVAELAAHLARYPADYDVIIQVGCGDEECDWDWVLATDVRTEPDRVANRGVAVAIS